MVYGILTKSVCKNNTLKVLHVGAHSNTVIPVNDLTDMGVVTSKRCCNKKKMECLRIQWSSTDPESTLKMMGKSVKKSSLKILVLIIVMWELPSGEAPAVGVHTQEEAVSPEKVTKWFQHVAV